YQTIGMITVGLNPFVDKTMASWLGEGSVSVLHYADRLYMIPVSFMCAGLFPVVLSHWSKDYYQKEEKSWLLQKVRNTAKLVLRTSSIIFLVLVLLSQSLVRLAFGHGKFDPKYLHILHWTFICYLFGLIPYTVGSMFTRGHLVLKNTSFLMKLAIFNCFLNVVLNYVLMQFIGVAGIALSTSITFLIIAILLFASFSQNLRRIYGKN
ncbi:polysaccharide biosynthesis C-terminal domain-containing protein, partial [Candidatus Aerophobetes bacterium]|nr:polysaccharide biosynthesis C-terminal domain-containing protein [Candidatus Aerophobetes bacterium]